MNAFDTSSLYLAATRADLPRGRGLLDASQLQVVLARTPAAVLLEVGYEQLEQFHVAHIPGACYLDTGELELAPLFNKIDDDALLALLLHCGTTVLLYGRSTLAAARAAHLLMYAGVHDVRLLDGGFATWQAAGLPCDAGPARPFTAVTEFGARFPCCPQLISTVEHARSHRGALVSVRTWSEFSGASSGYSYIAACGDIAGARWGRAGREGDVNSMSEYQHADGRMLPASAIERMWEGEGIIRGRPAIFYCGTGWRASLAFFYAYLMGWDDIRLYDGGWFEWSQDSANPIVVRSGTAVAARLQPDCCKSIAGRLQPDRRPIAVDCSPTVARM